MLKYFSLSIVSICFFACGLGGDCPPGEVGPNVPQQTYSGVVVEDSTMVPIEGCVVNYEATEYGMCGGWVETDSDVTDENGFFQLTNYYGITSGGAGLTYSKNGYSLVSAMGDTVKLSKE